MSNDGLPGVAMVVALLVGLLATVGLCERLLLWAFSALVVLVHA